MAFKLRVWPRLSPRIIEILPDTNYLTVQELYDGLLAWMAEPAHHSYLKLCTAEGKMVLDDVTKVGISLRLENAKLMFTGRTTPLETGGTCTQDDPRGMTLYATGGLFETNIVVPGCTVYNSTSKSMASVIEVISEQELLTFPMSGGTRNTWLNGDGYEIYENEQCEVGGGNVVAVDENGDSISPIYQSPNVQMILARSSSATLQEQFLVEYGAYGGVVTVDVVNGYVGTGKYMGTGLYPCKYMADAITIARSRGFRTFEVKGSLELTSEDYSEGFTFIGEAPHLTTFTIQPGANVETCEFSNATVEGTLDGDNTISYSYIGNLSYVNGSIMSCALGGTIVLGGDVQASVINCYSNVAGTGTPVIDMGGSGQSLSVRNYNGGLELTNKNGADNVSIDLNSGNVILADTVTDGVIVIRGVGTYENNSPIEPVTTGLISGNDITRLLGLANENTFIDNTVFDGDGQIIEARVRMFDSKTNAEAATDGGSETTGLLETYTAKTDWESVGRMQSYRLVRE